MAWPTTKNPRRNFVTLRLTDAEAADLDWLQGVQGTPDRSATLRTAYMRVVQVERRRAASAKRSSTGSHAPVMEADHDE